MSRGSPTPEQRAAIAAAGRSILIEAGAGTGKTGVMVDRYLRLVCDDGVEPDAVLAFTFTEKAAAELRQRIRSVVEERAAGGSERAAELLPGLGGSWVMTIHGFCNRLLMAHPVAARIDPRFRVLDAPEADRVAAEAFDRALEDFLAEGGVAREELVAVYDVAGLRALITDAHAELRSRGQAEPRLPDPPATDLAAAIRSAAEAAEATLAELKDGNQHRERVERALALLDGGAAPDLDGAASICTDRGGGALERYREATEALLSRVAEAGEGGEAYRNLGRLLELFSARFREAKDGRAGLDFEDLQLLAVRLLEESEVGSNYQRRFSHLLVDEFQDTNRLQMRLIRALHGPEAQLMVVGDELQSIYGFRHADLEVLREQRAAIEAGGGELLELSGNFRSRPEIIGAVNALGERVIGERFRPLRVGTTPGRDAPVGSGPAVELLLTGADGWDGDGIDLEPAIDARTPLNCLAEARFVAARLRELADGGTDRGGMVVLLRAFTHLDAYEDSLERAGLRPYVVGGRGYWSQQQVADVCALLAAIANPLDDQALFGSLASPACGAAPDTLWLLRRAAGKGRHVWPAVNSAAGLSEDEELAEPELLEAIPPEERRLLRRFAETLSGLRRRSPLLPLQDLIEALVSETGYDLAVLMRPAGEARFANVRKLIRLAAEFEAAEGRDLRGLLDFLAARAGADADPQAATAVEGHDGVRIMTTHSAKGLEFDVVVVPHLSRRLLRQSAQSPFALGREPQLTRVGLQLRRLGAPKVDLYAYRELCEEAKWRESEEELRLFHVAATRARERLILSGVVGPNPADVEKPGAPVVERIAVAFDLDREQDSTIQVPAPEARPGLEAALTPSEIAVRVSLASAERAAELTALRRDAVAAADSGEGPAPLLEPGPPPAQRRPLSYTAISAATGRRAQGEREEEPAEGRLGRLLPDAEQGANATGGDGGEPGGESGAAYGIAVHSMLEWSQANEWRQPSAELIDRFARNAGLDGAGASAETLNALFGAWTGCDFFQRRVLPVERRRAEVPLLHELSGTVLRGSIDLLVEADGAPPLIVDYKTDRLKEAGPAERVEQEYAVQRDLYALAVAEARGASEVEVAYVFLERPEEPVITRMGAPELEEARRRLGEAIAEISKPGIVAEFQHA